MTGMLLLCLFFHTYDTITVVESELLDWLLDLKINGPERSVEDDGD